MFAEQRFGVAEIERPSDVQMLGETADEARLGLGVEIDQYVSAEDGVERAAKRPVVQEVELSERDGTPEGGADLDLAGRTPDQGAGPQRGRDVVGAVGAVEAGLPCASTFVSRSVARILRSTPSRAAGPPFPRSASVIE